MKCHYLPWETELLGKKAYKVVFEAKNPRDGIKIPPISELLQSSVPSCSPKEPCFVSCRVPAANFDLVHMLETAGFHVVDCYLELELDKKRMSKYPGSSDVVPYNIWHLNTIVEIARTSFEYSRFHSDSNIPLEIANKSRQVWVENGCNGRADRVFISHVNGQPTGFLLANKKVEEMQTKTVLDLMAIDVKCRGLQHGSRLVEAFINYSIEENSDSAVVGTQAANIKAVNLYIKHGFRLNNVYYSLHYHK